MAFWQIVKASQLKNEKKKPTFFCVVKTGVVLQVRCLVVRLVVEEKLLSSTAAMFLLSQCACDVCVCVCVCVCVFAFPLIDFLTKVCVAVKHTRQYAERQKGASKSPRSLLQSTIRNKFVLHTGQPFHKKSLTFKGEKKKFRITLTRIDAQDQ